MPPGQFVIDSVKRQGRVWAGWFTCTCGARHGHGLGNGETYWTSGSRGAHCIPATAKTCSCGKWRIHPEHAEAALRNRLLGYSFTVPADVRVVSE